MENDKTDIVAIGCVLVFLSIILRWHEINFSLEVLIIWLVMSSLLKRYIKKSKVIFSDFYDGILKFTIDVFPLCGLFIFYNPHMHVIGVYMLLIGFALNSIVRLANKTKMPCRVSADKIKREDKIHVSMTHEPGSRTRLNVLGDWIPIYSSLLSPGDICLYAGPYVIAFQLLFWL